MEAGKKKYKILWNRVIIAVIVLAAVLAGAIWLLVKVISGIAGLFGGDESSSAKEAAVSVSDSSSAVSQTLQESSSETEIKKLKIVIDPGHGGTDAGALDKTETRMEKNDALRIALAVQKYLGEYENVEVIMTRTEDIFVSLDDRCRIANEADADLFVALHRNLFEGSAQGVEVWVSNKQPVVDTALAQNILDGLREVGISSDRGVQFGYIGNPNVNYQVNRETDMPSCLVEMGFMQDEQDNALFDEHCDEYAKAIAAAIYKTAGEAGLIEGTERTLPMDTEAVPAA